MPENQQNEEILAVAEEIRNYLATHPNAADTVEGIVKWWLRRQRYEESVQKVQHALKYLSDQGVIKRTHTADGTVIYARHSKKNPNPYAR